MISFYFALLTLLLGTIIMHWGLYLIHQGAIVRQRRKEPYLDYGMPDTSHTVDLPLTTTTSCQNFCGPPARCSLTGESCLSDVDCFGCSPVVSPTREAGEETPAFNHAGKILAVQPDYSVLTTDITRDRYAFVGKEDTPPPDYFKGTNTWSLPFSVGFQQYEATYAPSLSFQETPVSYPPGRVTLSGEFADDGPPAANS